MSTNRVQKLLFSEYCDFEDMVLIESPFAQTTKAGTGIRQVHLGLTPSKLVMATDVLPPVEYVNFTYTPGIDPDIETFELIAIYPVECVNLSIYRRRKTQALKARFCNNKVLYFELGGFEKRAMFWNLWCERVKFLCPGDANSSRSETSVATSSTGSTLYLMEKKVVTTNGLKQLWCKFGPNSVFNSNKLVTSMPNNQKSRWTDRNLYLGKKFDVSNDYRPVMMHPELEQFIKSPSKTDNKIVVKMHRPEISTYQEEHALNFGDNVPINRFGSGVNEGCNMALYLTVDDYVIPRRYSQILDEAQSANTVTFLQNMGKLAESAVLLWEFYRGTDVNKYKIRHKRRYGLSTQPLLMYGLGVGSLTPSSRFSLLCKRVSSETNLTLNDSEGDFTLTLSKTQLVASPSQQFYCVDKASKYDFNMNAPKAPVIFFWTPKYKYRPKSSRHLFQERIKYFKKINDFHEFKAKPKRKKCFKRKNNRLTNKNRDSDEDSNDEPHRKKVRKKKHSFIYNMFGSKIEEFAELQTKRNPKETYLQFLKRMLKQDTNLSIWNFDSTTIAEQLTIIDKDFFLKITSVELKTLQKQANMRHAPNVYTMLIFAHRVSCLLATEILAVDSERTRARLVARYINVADKCHKMANFQSCKSILAGLQSPAIYRLRNTWAYVRKKHASKYQNFEYLSRFYKDPRLPNYQRALNIVTQSGTYLPYLGDIISKLADKLPEYSFDTVSSSPSLDTVLSSKTSSLSREKLKESPTLFTKFLKVFIAPEVAAPPQVCTSPTEIKTHPKRTKTIKFIEMYEHRSATISHEDRKDKAFRDTIVYLQKGQLAAMDYNFQVHAEARDYLLKARYNEYKVNFYKSLSLESPVNYYQRRSK